MARIRSVHPGQWTDEDFVSCSAFARLLAIALRNEADDFGVFEWKPIGLKMRLFPVDAVDMVVLLAELVASNQIRSFELDGRKYGAIRNFTTYQRPKKPNSFYPMPDEFRTYVGLTGASSPPTVDECGAGGELTDDEAAPVPPKSEIGPQMEEKDGGGGKEEGGKKTREGAEAPGCYAFCGQTVSIKDDQHRQWQKAFPNIQNLLGCYASYDAWITSQPEAKRKGWFHGLAGQLARRDAEYQAQRATEKTRQSTGTYPI